MIVPAYLEKGDLIGLITPSGKIDTSVVIQAESILKSMEFNSIRGQHITDSFHQFGSTDINRATDFNNMLNNPQVKAIWCTRGGYGALRLLDLIDFSLFKKNPKWLIGFSDITVFHSVIQNNLKFLSIHGDMPINLIGKHPGTNNFSSLLNLLRGDLPEYHLKANENNVLGSSRGILIGGNLSLLSILAGSKYDFNPKGKILFIEDRGEYLYHIDRMLQGLKIAGKLKELSGMIIGDFTEMRDSDPPFGSSVYEIISDLTKEYDFPVLFNFPAGHALINEPLLLGATIDLNVQKKSVSIKYIL